MRAVKTTRSLGFRLSLVVVAAAFLGIVTTVGFFLAQDFRQTVEAEQVRLKSSAAAFGAAMSLSVARSDTRGALEVLRGLRDLPNVRYASVSDADGVLIAEIGGTAMLMGRDGAAAGKGLWAFLTAETVSVDHEIPYRGQVVGTMQLHAEIGWVRERYVEGFLIAISFGSLVIALTILIARLRVRKIVDPLRTLTSKISDIDQDSDLSLRLERQTDDEVGVLIDAFNDMFKRIAERDRLLKRHRDTLEETVQIRTAELVTAKDEAERANAAKSDFLATMSHEIRTPMNGMMVMAEMLSAAPLSPKHLRYSEVIARSGRGLLNIINDILDFSKIESGRMDLEEIPFAIDTLVEDVASLFAERAREKSLTIATFVAPNVPLEIVGDPTRVNQVVTNLVNNALKFTESGGVTIEVQRAPDQPADKDRVELLFNVRDSGIGIAKDKIDQVFERFSQADQSITRKFGGTGLGLSISKKLVAAMDGELSADSELGKGSCFWFRVGFPVSKAAPDKAGFDGRTVALVDSDPISWGSTCNALLLRGARLAETDLMGNVAECDLVLVRSQDLGKLEEMRCAGSGDTPVVVLQPFAATDSVRLPGGFELAAEVQLPLRRADATLLAQCVSEGDYSAMRTESRARFAVSEMPDFSATRVLAVDDTAVNREVLSEALASLGIRADLAESGPEAIEKVGAKSYDVIFMDCSMPEMDGFEATAAIRDLQASNDQQPVQIVALTAHVTGAEATRWREAGMDAYIAKPFTIAQLISVIEPLAKGQAAEPEAADESTAAQPEPSEEAPEVPVEATAAGPEAPKAVAPPVAEPAAVAESDSAGPEQPAEPARPAGPPLSTPPLIAPQTLEMFAMLFEKQRPPTLPTRFSGYSSTARRRAWKT